MNSLLPNCRWLTLPSNSLGRDWFLKSQELDALLVKEGMDLAEESVYLLFSHDPSEILEGEGSCLIARSVIGPKKNMEAPVKLVDWVAAPVWRMEIQAKNWEEVLEKAEDLKVKASQDGKLAGGFVLYFKRRLNVELALTAEVLFNQ